MGQLSRKFRQGIGHGGSIHPKLHKEANEKLQVPVFGCHGGDYQTEPQGQHDQLDQNQGKEDKGPVDMDGHPRKEIVNIYGGKHQQLNGIGNELGPDLR